MRDTHDERLLVPGSLDNVNENRCKRARRAQMQKQR